MGGKLRTGWQRTPSLSPCQTGSRNERQALWSLLAELAEGSSARKGADSSPSPLCPSQPPCAVGCHPTRPWLCSLHRMFLEAPSLCKGVAGQWANVSQDTAHSACSEKSKELAGLILSIRPTWAGDPRDQLSQSWQEHGLYTICMQTPLLGTTILG